MPIAKRFVSGTIKGLPAMARESTAFRIGASRAFVAATIMPFCRATCKTLAGSIPTHTAHLQKEWRKARRGNDMYIFLLVSRRCNMRSKAISAIILQEALCTLHFHRFMKINLERSGNSCFIVIGHPIEDGIYRKGIRIDLDI